MAPFTINFTTGPSVLPDVGTLSYNGCIFSPLFTSEVSGIAVKDNALRTVKYMEYTITVDGYVTLKSGLTSISPTMDTLRKLLSAQGGVLEYKGRGCDIIVNRTGAGFINRDVAWGPVPELLEFQPMGGGLSAKVRWQVKTRITEVTRTTGKAGGIAAIPLLQFNYESSVAYGEDYYATLTVRGTAEIPMTRTPSQTTRTVSNTADDVRNEIEKRVLPGIDLDRFRITRREFTLSRDKRTLEWNITAEEKPYMDMPIGCTIARGTYSVRPAKSGMGLCMWLCTLRATYTIRADWPRRDAWMAFLALLRLRMGQSELSPITNIEAEKKPERGAAAKAIDLASYGSPLVLLGKLQSNITKATPKPRQAWLIDFSFDEGLYMDSKTTTFSATWKLTTTFSHILLASGIWIKVPEKDSAGKNLWATSMRDISGVDSWPDSSGGRLRADPNLDIIVDFGS